MTYMRIRETNIVVCRLNSIGAKMLILWFVSTGGFVV
jgi:hypothetical protein